MRLVICQLALIGLSRATRAKDMKDEAFAWPWDQDSHHAAPHHLGGLMAARAQVHHQRNMFDSSSSDFSNSFSNSFSSSSDFASSSDFSTDSDSGSGGDFMDKYITETGGKPMQVDGEKPPPKKQDDGIPDMASLFGDSTATPQEKPKEQEPWRSSPSTDVDNMFSGSFGNFGASAQASFDEPKPARHADNAATSTFTDDMTNLFGGSSDSAVAPPAPAANTDNTDSSASGWPWDTHAKKESVGHHSRNLWGSDSDSSSSSSSSSGTSNDMVNMFGGSSSGSSSGSSDSSSSKDNGSSRNLFDEWSAFGGSNSGADSGVSQPAHAPQQQNDASQGPADSPIQGPTQREGSIAGASAHDQVVDVRLSSELQQSLLQARSAEKNMLQRFRGISKY